MEVITRYFVLGMFAARPGAKVDPFQAIRRFSEACETVQTLHAVIDEFLGGFSAQPITFSSVVLDDLLRRTIYSPSSTAPEGLDKIEKKFFEIGKIIRSHLEDMTEGERTEMLAAACVRIGNSLNQR